MRMITNGLLASCIVLVGSSTLAFGQSRDREGEAMIGGMMGMFGQIIELEREKARNQQQNRGGNAGAQNGTNYAPPAYALPDRPQLPPLPTDGQRSQWKN
jgi:hypothetical protein